jgi:hypothetical protein
MKRTLLAALMLLAAGCGSGGSSWACNWQCLSNETSGTKTYPSGPDPTDQCAIDFSNGCASFNCSCTQ